MAAVALLGAAIIVVRLAQLPATLASLVGGIGALGLVVAAALFGFWAYTCATLEYLIQDGVLVIKCGAVRHSIPLHLIREIRKGYAADPGIIRGVSWPGFHMGFAKVDELGLITFYSTHRHHDELIYLATEFGAFGVSLDEEEMRREIAGGAAARLDRPQLSRWSVLNAGFWTDRRFLAVLGAAVVVNLIMLVYAFARYPALPELVPVHFTAFGTIDRIGYRSELLRVPFMALFLWAVDSAVALGLYSIERVASSLLVVTGLVVQITFLIAVVRFFSA